MSDYNWIGGVSSDASAAPNYSAPNLPTGGDNLYFGALGQSSVAVSLGLAALAGITLGKVSFASAFTAAAGLAPQVTYNITAGSRTGAGPYTATLTTSANHGYAVGDTAVIAGVSPSGYNGTQVITAVTANTFSYSLVSDPGAYTSGGTVTRLSQFQVPASICRIGDPSLSGSNGNGSPRLNLDFLASACAATVLGTTASVGTDATLEPVRLKFNNASASLQMEGGRVGIATNTPSDTSTIGTINVSGGVLDIGAGVTLTSVEQDDGTINSYSGASGQTYTCNGGTLNLLGSTIVGTVYALSGGTVNLNVRPASGAALTTLNLRGGVLDLTGNPAPLTITNVNLRDGQIKEAYVGQLTVTNWTVDMTDKTTLAVNRS